MGLWLLVSREVDEELAELTATFPTILSTEIDVNIVQSTSESDLPPWFKVKLCGAFQSRVGVTVVDRSPSFPGVCARMTYDSSFK